jgi:pimeloyl-ACP methyl ester carboxylesterase
MATFVLVHGAWSGGWGYSEVARRLRAHGHDVYTPTNTGLGERVHLAHPGIDLTCHIKDITNVFDYERLSDVILVGHSYGGMVITGVSSVCADKIRTLVYLDAFLPENGQSLADIAGHDGAKFYIDGQRDSPGMVRPPSGGTDPARPLNPHPLLTLIEPVKLSGAEKQIKNRTYILADKIKPAGFQRFYDKVKGAPGWKAVTIATGHVVMMEDPEGLTKILLEEVDR